MYVGVVAVLAAVVVAACGAPAPQEDKYTTKYDAVDVNQILHNERLFAKYVQCLLDDEGCTPDANELKRVLPDALNTECSKCSDAQKEKADKVFIYVYNNKKDVFDKFAEKFDPKGEHREKYSRYAEDKGIKL